MLLNLDGGFAYLALTKTGSTSVETMLRPHCQIMFTGDHRVSHMPAHHFERFVRPYLTECGFPAIDTVAQLRHPLDWLESWWRYRSKPRPGESHTDTSGVAFETFALEYIDGADRPYLGMHRQLGFVCDHTGAQQADILFRYEDMAAFHAFLEHRIGQPLTLPRHNKSPRRWARISRGARARVETFFTPELDLWEGKTTRDPTLRIRAR
ncbi:MAG: hypothetical protein AAGA19_01000 [Pseudomonadota bacterium]